MIRAAIIGASGYAGAELLRILARHPGVEVTVCTAKQYAGEKIAALYPSLTGAYDGDFVQYRPDEVNDLCDVAFLGLPHGESMHVAPELLAAGKRVVDLSADFRFHEAQDYQWAYGVEHAHPQLLAEAVYGLPELNREKIAEARLVANPGCYPTSVLLGLAPLVTAGLIAGTVIVDAKSGVSGAGRSLSLGTHFPQVSESISPYAVSGHRHHPEMVKQLEALGGSPVDVVFAPHLVPMSRGILSTMYVTLAESLPAEQAMQLYTEHYDKEPFVTMLPAGHYPHTKSVTGSNNCFLALEEASGGSIIVVMSAIDNLVKGASGQAVQCMNIMCGLPEAEGLGAPGLFP